MPSVIVIILGSNIEDFIQSLKHQNIVLEVDDFVNRNGTESLSYNGAIIVSGRQKVSFPLGVAIVATQLKPDVVTNVKAALTLYEVV